MPEDGEFDSRPDQAAIEAAIADFPKRLESVQRMNCTSGIGGKAIQTWAKPCKPSKPIAAKIPTFKTRSGDSIGMKSIIWKDMREQEFARFSLITEVWVPTSGVQKLWTKIGLHAID